MVAVAVGIVVPCLPRRALQRLLEEDVASSPYSAILLCKLAVTTIGSGTIHTQAENWFLMSAVWFYHFKPVSSSGKWRRWQCLPHRAYHRAVVTV